MCGIAGDPRGWSGVPNSNLVREHCKKYHFTVKSTIMYKPDENLFVYSQSYADANSKNKLFQDWILVFILGELVRGRIRN